MATDELRNSEVVRHVDELCALADTLQRDHHPEVAKSGVRLASHMIRSKLAGVDLLLPGARNSNWEPRSAAVAAAGQVDDMQSLDVFLAAAEAGTHYWRPIYTIADRIGELRERMKSDDLTKARLIIDAFLGNKDVSGKTRDKLITARTVVA